MISFKQCLEDLNASLKQQQKDWLCVALSEIGKADDPLEACLPYSAMARRKIGDSDFNALGAHWTCTDAVRMLLYQRVLQKSNDLNILQDAYRFGDELERGAILKSLSLLDPAGILVELAVNAGRTNSTTLFSAIALFNAYPSRHYSEAAFNQLIIKALFLDLNISYIYGLQKRINTTLTQICLDFIKERIAAGRNLPYSIDLAINLTELNTEDKALCRQYF